MPQLHPLSWFSLFLVFVGFVFIMISMVNAFFFVNLSGKMGTLKEFNLSWKW